jgi:phage recombination protein Bet
MTEISTETPTENSVIVTNNQIAIADTLDMFSESQVSIVKANLARNTSNSELAYFLHVCQSLELNPLNKEIWCYKDNKGNLLVFAGRDGFLAKAQRSPFYNGIRSSAICANDEYSIDIPNGEIKHLITKPKPERGAIIYGYAIVFRKNGEQTVEIADFQTYNKGRNAWNSHPEEMIKKVAETHALKKAFGISGLQSEYDFDVNNGVVVPINTQKPTLDKLEEIYKDKKKLVSHEDQMHFERIIEEKEESSYAKAIKNLKSL